jgi:hypothetical protein
MTKLSRRQLLKALGLGAALAPLGFQACLAPQNGFLANVADSGPKATPDVSSSDVSGSDVGSPDDITADTWGNNPPDTWRRFQDVQADVNRQAETQLDTGQPLWPLTIAAPFQVYLGDTDCSKHPHMCMVPAGVYQDNQLVEVKGGHPMALRPLEMKLLEQGGQIPYHTLPHNGHHHCGTGIRQDLFQDTFDNDSSKLDDYFQCVVPDATPEDTPEQFSTFEYGPCTAQKFHG